MIPGVLGLIPFAVTYGDGVECHPLVHFIGIVTAEDTSDSILVTQLVDFARGRGKFNDFDTSKFDFCASNLAESLCLSSVINFSFLNISVYLSEAVLMHWLKEDVAKDKEGVVW